MVTASVKYGVEVGPEVGGNKPVVVAIRQLILALNLDSAHRRGKLYYTHLVDCMYASVGCKPI